MTTSPRHHTRRCAGRQRPVVRIGDHHFETRIGSSGGTKTVLPWMIAVGYFMLRQEGDGHRAFALTVNLRETRPMMRRARRRRTSARRPRRRCANSVQIYFVQPTSLWKEASYRPSIAEHAPTAEPKVPTGTGA